MQQTQPSKRVLVTGAAGFIGSHLVDHLLGAGWAVTGIDNFDPFYDEATKRSNLACALSHKRFSFIEMDIRNGKAMNQLLAGGYDVIVHLAAKAGVRRSIEDPVGYLETNVLGTQNMLELARTWKSRKFIFASSSSVYGINPNTPWSETCSPLLPISPYASTKLSAELMGHVYSQLYDIQFLALRFFTVYGPRQRPDLAINKFTRLLQANQPIPMYGDGSTMRDYTYIGDICAGIRQAIAYDGNAFDVFNLGSNRPITLMHLIQSLGRVVGKEPLINHLPEQPGDVKQTWANVEKASREICYSPQTSLEDGLRSFAEWFAGIATKDATDIDNTSVHLNEKSSNG